MLQSICWYLLILLQLFATIGFSKAASVKESTADFVFRSSGACQLCLLICQDFRSANDEGDELTLNDRGSINDGKDFFPNDDRNLRNGRNFLSLVVPKHELQNDNCPYYKSDAKLLLSSINRVLNFYENNLEKLDQRTDGGVGLSVLKSQANYILQTLYANRNLNESKTLDSLIKMFENIYEKSGKYSKIIFDLSSKHEKYLPNKKGLEIFSSTSEELVPLNTGKNWKPLDTITKHYEEFEDVNIGDEPEVIFPFLDFQCLTSVMKDCKPQHICEKMYLGNEIYSQYMLTHQILVLLMAKQKSCEKKNPMVFQGKDVFMDKLCSKAYLEAKYLAAHDFPKRFRDLFAEQIAFCGLAGYRNFLRPDWLHELISWQSKKDEGCFPNIYGASRTTDVIVETESEKFGDEACLVHLTSVSLAAYAVQLSYMFDTCGVEIFY